MPSIAEDAQKLRTTVAEMRLDSSRARSQTCKRKNSDMNIIISQSQKKRSGNKTCAIELEKKCLDLEVRVELAECAR